MLAEQGIFYNQDMFAANGISVPTTWEDLMAAAKKLKAAGITPFSNGLKDEWDINEVVWMGLLPSAIGGRDARLAYLNGQTCFNDAKMVASFQQIADLQPYLPKGYQAIGVNDAENLFVQGKAAMMFDGSWMPRPLNGMFSRFLLRLERICMRHSMWMRPSV